jgi:hypothetical protein
MEDKSMKKVILLLIAVVHAALAGQSAVLLPSTQWLNILNMPRTDWQATSSWRVEFQIHNWTLPTYYPYFFQLGNGAAVIMTPQGGLAMFSSDNTNGIFCNLSLAGSNTLIRLQKLAGVPELTCEAWNYDGTGYQSNTAAISTPIAPATSGGYIGNSVGVELGFMRVFTTTVALGSRPPTTADHGDYMELTFDGTLADATGRGHNATNAGSSSVTFVPTPNQRAFAFPKVLNAPFWTNSTSLRAGNDNQFDGTLSYSLGDSTSAVSYFWTQLAGPTITDWIDRTSSQPTIRGANLVFGDYTYNLTVTDVDGNSNSASLETGSVAMDNNGVVVQANPLIDTLFGPMIAFGRNPWGYQDYWSQHASILRGLDYATPVLGVGLSYPGWSTLGKPQWEFFGQGTISYYFNCVGTEGYCNGSVITLNGAITPASTSIVVNNASLLDLTSFPTRVWIFDGTNEDELRVCSSSGNTLTLCYDPAALPRHSFAAGINVHQSKVTGTGTLFLSDPNAAVCPVGAPGLPGLASYSTGTVQLAAGSTAMSGSGTAWSSPAVQPGLFVQVHATHSGVPFTFMALIASVNGPAGITLGRPFPADADSAAGLTYHVMPATRTLDMQATNPVDPSGIRQILQGTDGCESETDVYTNPISFGLGNSFANGRDILALDGKHFTGQKYSITDTNGWVANTATGGINFYGEDLAHWALYFRSGLNLPKATAHSISDYWARSPWANGGYDTLEIGGGVLGAFLSVITGENSSVTWQNDLRGFAGTGAFEVQNYVMYGCNADDTRDSGYAYAFLILASIYDPDTTSTDAPGGIPWRSFWQSFLPQMEANDAKCVNQTGVPSQAYSWANGLIFNSGAGPRLTVTNGSATATGSGIQPAFCVGVAQGTATVTNGSNVMTLLTGFPGPGTDNTSVMLTGTSGGQPFVQSIEYAGPVGSTVTLGEYWLGDSGTVSWMSQANIVTAYMMTIATNNDDLANLQKNWACIYNSPSSITLNRPWDGVSGTYTGFNGNGLPLAGYGQQPFMLGIKTYGMNLLANQTLPALSSYVGPYNAFTSGAASWIWNVGMDRQLFTTNYGRIFQQIEPTNTSPPGTSMAFRSPASTYGLQPSGLPSAREQNSETGAAHGIYYASNPTPANKLLGDEYYGAVWGHPAYTNGGVYSDPYSSAGYAAASNLQDGNIHSGKWPGFFTGIGMSHRWPAVRQGGVQSPSPRTINVGVCFYDSSTCRGTPPSATQVTVTLTLPNGNTSTNTCFSGTSCPVTGDGRMGAQYLVRIQYQSSSGTVLQQGSASVTAP